MRIGLIGGGPVGLISALALKHNGHKVRLFDSTMVKPKMTLALAESTLVFLDRLGINLSKGQNLTEILVTEQGLPGSMRLVASDCGYPRFGQVVCSHALEHALLPLIDDLIEAVYVDRVIARSASSNPKIKLASGEEWDPDLVIVADGGRSGLTEGLGLTVQQRPFHRSIILGRMKAACPIAGRAYERFIGTGPLAVLPLDPSIYGFAWSLNPSHADDLVNCHNTLLKELSDAMPRELGVISLASKPVVIPLIERWVDRPYRPGVVLIGNGAQIIHPVAGQGLNLALRGVHHLIKELDSKPPDEAVRVAFDSFKSNRNLTRFASSGLELIFNHDTWARKLVTIMGLTLGDQSRIFKTKIAEFGMGILS